MAQALRTTADALPLTYAFDALHRVTTDGSLGSRGALDVVVIVGVTLLALALGAATLRRRTPRAAAWVVELPAPWHTE